MLHGLVALLTSSAQIVYNKNVLSRHHVGFLTFTFVDFFLIFILMGLAGIFFFDFSTVVWSLRIVLLVFLSGALSLGFNLLYYKGLEKTTVEKAQPLILTNWIFSIILAFAFFPAEREYLDLFLSLLAGIAVVITFTKKHHLNFDKSSMLFILSSFLIGIHAILIKVLLDYFGPYELYFLRLGIELVLFICIFAPSARTLKNNNNKFIAVSAVIAIIMNVFTYWSYQNVGIIFTSMVLTLTPLLAILGGRLFLQEKLHIKYVASSLLIMICIGLSTIL